MLLENVSIHTEYSICSLLIFFFIITCSFAVFVENCVLLPKGINELVVFLSVLYMYGLDFLSFYPDFYH